MNMKKIFLVLVLLAFLVSACGFPTAYKLTMDDGDVVFVDANKYNCYPKEFSVRCSDNGFSYTLTYYGVEKFETLYDDVQP